MHGIDSRKVRSGGSAGIFDVRPFELVRALADFHGYGHPGVGTGPLSLERSVYVEFEEVEVLFAGSPCVEAQVSGFGRGVISRFGRLGIPDVSGYERVGSEGTGRGGYRPRSDGGSGSPSRGEGSPVFETRVPADERRIVDLFKYAHRVPGVRDRSAPCRIDGVGRVDPGLSRVLVIGRAREEVGIGRVRHLPRVGNADSVDAVEKAVVVSLSPFREKVVEEILYAAVLVDSSVIEVSRVPIRPLVLSRLFAAGSNGRAVRGIAHVANRFRGYAGQPEDVFTHQPVALASRRVRVRSAVVGLREDFYGRSYDVREGFVERAGLVGVGEVRGIVGPGVAEFVGDDVDGREFAQAGSVAVAEVEALPGRPERVGVVRAVVHDEMRHRLLRVGEFDVSDAEPVRLEEVEGLLKVVARRNFYRIAVPPIIGNAVGDVVGVHVLSAVSGNVVDVGQPVDAVEDEMASVIAAVRSRERNVRAAFAGKEVARDDGRRVGVHDEARHPRDFSGFRVDFV